MILLLIYHCADAARRIGNKMVRKETDRCTGQIAGCGQPQKEDLVTRELLLLEFRIGLVVTFILGSGWKLYGRATSGTESSVDDGKKA